jgi:nucleotide-binding universal stress UspA family protein
MKDFKKILVPFDGSDHSKQALEQAVFLANLCQAELVLLHVVDLNRKISSFEQVSTGGYIPNELKEDGYKLIGTAMATIPEAIKATSVVEIGSPAEIITEICSAGEYDLIIMGSRGLNKFKQIFMGSVSQYVLAHASCPVMVIR